MYISNALRMKIRSDRMAAIKLDKAISGVEGETRKTLKNIASGAERLSWYTSCLILSYQDVCRELASEDSRLVKAIWNALERPDVIKDMIIIYLSCELLKMRRDEEKNKNSTSEKILKINSRMGKILSDYANKKLTTEVVANTLSTMVINSLNFKTIAFAGINRYSIWVVRITNVYGYAQTASDSARKLKYCHPDYYKLLYKNEIEMLYFIIEPGIQKAIQNSVGKEGLDRLIRIMDSLIK